MSNRTLEEEDALQTKEALESLASIASSLKRIADVMEETRPTETRIMPIRR